MAISITLSEYLSQHDINFELIQHRHTQSSLDSSCSAHLSSAQVAKGVILKNQDDEYLMATRAADHRLAINEVNTVMGKEYQLVPEARLRDIFPDCAQGAIPGIGAAFAIPNIIDDALLKHQQIYFEGGDHHILIRLEHHQYAKLVGCMPHGKICGTTIGIPKETEHFSKE